VSNQLDFVEVNEQLQQVCGIINFFDNEDDFSHVKNEIKMYKGVVCDSNRSDYGDFQTPIYLSNAICSMLLSSGISPELVVEPTCGKGSFIVSALKYFPTIQYVLGVEIYKEYVYRSKFSILDFFLSNKDRLVPRIEIRHQNVFEFNFDIYRQILNNKKVLVLGNPPWVTNAMLGSLESSNVPVKSNFKKHNGFDAITGKGNFDIAEYITLMVIKEFSRYNGHLALLLKNSVIKNIIFDQQRNQYRISSPKKFKIDAKQEFNASVEASLFFCQFNSDSDYQCTEMDFYDKSVPAFKFGWIDDKFVSNTVTYHERKSYDGKSLLEWRSGVKHDCSAILELSKDGDLFKNKLKQRVSLEDDLLYPFVKGSQLKENVIGKADYYTIITQTKVGQDTSFIQKSYPLTYSYLNANEQYFTDRKSSIYKDKPRFSIFGIGDYTFKPFKVAIASLYKVPRFSLVIPDSNKPILLDDTCYFIGFNKLSDAVFAYLLLNNFKTLKFVESIVFSDSMRVYTKEVLMRIDLARVADGHDLFELRIECEKEIPGYATEITEDNWYNFRRLVQPLESIQTLELFN
jgi:hypothetical protein